jgi:hypothetical protein
VFIVELPWELIELLFQDPAQGGHKLVTATKRQLMPKIGA